ncbi:MAG: benzaldehyde lyase [Caulobacter sp.]|nr:benzaldehyde lyase [Caulobacter sp.]
MTEPMGGALLAETLFALGVRDVFTLHGGHLDPFLVAAPGVGIRLVDVRHEASAGHAAEAYAMLRSGEVGVCVATAGPGFTNILTAMASAYANAVPTLFIAGGPPMAEEATNELQGGINQVAMAMPVAKWAHRVSVIERLPDQVEKAMRLALAGRPGPVFLEIPINVMFGRAARIFFPVKAGRPDRSRPTLSRADAERVLDALATAERPLIIGGSGAVLSGASGALDRFVRVTGLPVATNSKAHGLLASDHPNSVGPAGLLAGLKAAGAPRPDLVVLLGARAGLLLGGRSGAVIPRDCRILQIDIDGAEPGRLTGVELGVVGDCAAVLEVLTEAAEARDWPSLAGWTESLRALRGVVAEAAFPTEGPNGRIHPHHAARAVFEAMGPDAICAVDGGEMTAWCEPLNRASRPGHYLTAGYLGALGIGQGFAMAAAVACPDRPVFLLSGDGALGFNLQEFDTMARHGLPVITIVMNNACWAMSKNAQDIVFGAERRTAVMLSDTRYDQVAIALGCDGEHVTVLSEIGPAIGRALASGRPTCINIATDPDVMHPITFGMAGADPAKGKITMPYYQNE